MKSLLYRFGRFISSIYIRTVFRLKVHGLDNLPERKPFIICANHISMIDPMTVGISIPGHYRIKYMAKSELFKNPILSMILHKLEAFPVNRQEADFAAIKKAYRILAAGEVLGLFPEGSRSKSGEMQQAYNGAALIAVRSGVPILPIAIKGPYRFCRPVHVFIGEPFVMPPLQYQNKEEKKRQLDMMSRQIMDTLAGLIAQPGD